MGDTKKYIQRTEGNVRDSDGTVVFSIATVLTEGSKKTVELAQKHGKPCLHLSAQRDGDKAPGVASFVPHVLTAALT